MRLRCTIPPRRRYCSSRKPHRWETTRDTPCDAGEDPPLGSYPYLSRWPALRIGSIDHEPALSEQVRWHGVHGPRSSWLASEGDLGASPVAALSDVLTPARSV